MSRHFLWLLWRTSMQFDIAKSETSFHIFFFVPTRDYIFCAISFILRFPYFADQEYRSTTGLNTVFKRLLFNYLSSPIPIMSNLYPVHLLVIPMYICTSQSLFSHSYSVNEWLNRHSDAQIDIGIRADELGTSCFQSILRSTWLVACSSAREDSLPSARRQGVFGCPKQSATVSVGSVLKWRARR
jgi:hypothetical protein